MHFRSSFEEESCCSYNKETLKHNWVTFSIFLNNLFKKIWSLFNIFSELTNYPNKGRLTSIIGKLGNNLSIEEYGKILDHFRIFSKNIFQNKQCFSGDIGNSQCQKVSKLTSNILCNRWKSHNNGSKALNWFLSNFHIDVCNILTKLIDNLLNIVLTGNMS